MRLSSLLCAVVVAMAAVRGEIARYAEEQVIRQRVLEHPLLESSCWYKENGVTDGLADFLGRRLGGKSPGIGMAKSLLLHDVNAGVDEQRRPLTWMKPLEATHDVVRREFLKAVGGILDDLDPNNSKE